MDPVISQMLVVEFIKKFRLLCKQQDKLTSNQNAHQMQP